MFLQSLVKPNLVALFFQSFDPSTTLTISLFEVVQYSFFAAWYSYRLALGQTGAQRRFIPSSALLGLNSQAVLKSEHAIIFIAGEIDKCAVGRIIWYIYADFFLNHAHFYWPKTTHTPWQPVMCL